MAHSHPDRLSPLILIRPPPAECQGRRRRRRSPSQAVRRPPTRSGCWRPSARVGWRP